MPKYAAVAQAYCWEDHGVHLMARIKGQDAELVTQASITSGTYVVTNVSTAAEIVGSTALTIASVIFDTLQTDARWSKAGGYNFRFFVPKTACPTADPHRVEIDLVPTSGGAAESIALVWDVEVTGLYRS